jgi:hypothetical protein
MEHFARESVNRRITGTPAAVHDLVTASPNNAE